MTLEVFHWYRVKDTGQFCQVTGIASASDPQIRVQSADGGLKGFHAYLLWLTPGDGPRKPWTKRAILMDLGKAALLLREPAEKDAATLETLKSLAPSLPLASASLDGTRTEPTSEVSR